MEYVDINSLVILLKDATLKDIYDIRDVFKCIYKAGNIKDYYSNDLERLKNLESEILVSTEQVRSKGKTYRYALDNLLKCLDSIIKRLE